MQLSFEAKISIDIQQTFFFFCNNVSIIENKIFATDFLRFFRVISKKRKVMFFKSEKNSKNTHSRTLLLFAWDEGQTDSKNYAAAITNALTSGETQYISWCVHSGFTEVHVKFTNLEVHKGQCQLKSF